MKTLIKLAMATTLVGVLLSAGCVRTLNPIYTSSDVVFKEALIGTWRQGQDNNWQFTESPKDERDRGYRLVLTDAEGRPGTFLAHLVELDDKLFLDLYPVAPDASENGYYKLHFLRAHTFLHVQLDESTIKLAAMSPRWLESYLKKQPDALAHTTVTASGHAPPESEQAASERLVVTAPTEEIQSFLLSHLDTEGAFGDPIELTQIEE